MKYEFHPFLLLFVGRFRPGRTWITFAHECTWNQTQTWKPNANAKLACYILCQNTTQKNKDNRNTCCTMLSYILLFYFIPKPIIYMMRIAVVIGISNPTHDVRISILTTRLAIESYTDWFHPTPLAWKVGHNLGANHPFYDDEIWKEGETGGIMDYSECSILPALHPLYTMP